MIRLKFQSDFQTLHRLVPGVTERENAPHIVRDAGGTARQAGVEGKRLEHGAYGRVVLFALGMGHGKRALPPVERF